MTRKNSDMTPEQVERTRATNRRHYAENKKYHYEKHRRYYESHRAYEAAGWKAWRDALRDQMITAYGGRCTCCGEDQRQFLTLEHIGGGGRKDRKKSHHTMIWSRLRKAGWPKDKYTILCYNCNCTGRFKAGCPHKYQHPALGICG